MTPSKDSIKSVSLENIHSNSPILNHEPGYENRSNIFVENIQSVNGEILANLLDPVLNISLSEQGENKVIQGDLQNLTSLKAKNFKTHALFT